MRDRLAIEIGASSLHCALKRRTTIVWTRDEVIGAKGLSVALTSALRELPRSRLRRRPLVGVTLDSPHAQVRRLEGLPPLRNSAMLTQLVRQNQGAFFLRSSGPRVIPEVWQATDGTVWGTSLDESILNDLVGATNTSRLAIVAVGPRSSSLEFLHTASVCRRGSPLSWRPAMAAPQAKAMRRVGAFVCVALFITAVAAAVAAPAVRAIAFNRDASTKLAALRKVEQEAGVVAADLRRVTQTLDGVNAFSAERGHIARMLGDLSQVIPDSTAVITFRADSLEGTLVAVAPHVMDVLPELSAVHDMENVRVAGSVTREIVAGAPLERATFRFRRHQLKRAPATGAKR